MARKMKRGIVALVCSLAIVPMFSLVAHAQLSPKAKAEISHLLDYVQNSGCEFYRNGVWYKDPKVARGHLEDKYHLYELRINSAEDFIKWAGTKSEESGKPYMVRCGNEAPILTSKWLAMELKRYRRQKRHAPSRPR